MARTETLYIGPWQLDSARNRLVGPRRSVRLTSLEVALLQYLGARSSENVPREELLRQVWGYHSDVSRRTVDVSIWRLRRKLEPDPKQPRYLITARQAGYRLNAQPKPVASEAPAGEVLLPLVGRREELSGLQALLTRARLVTLTGPPGVGKTRLAQAAAQGAHTLATVELTPARNQASVLSAISAALSVAESTEPAEALARALRARGQVLLVLDNAEHVLGPLRALLPGWLAAAPELVVLVTSQAALKLQAEHRVVLGPLPLEDARALFLRVAQRAGGPLLGEVPAALLERLDRLPLAIELAASRTDVFGVMELLGALDRPLAVLRRPGAARTDALEGAIAWSWSLLSEAARDGLRRWAVFEGRFDLQLAGGMLDGGPPAFERLAELASRSLLSVERGSDGGRRYRMLWSVRAFARKQGALEGIGALHAHALAALVRPYLDGLPEETSLSPLQDFMPDLAAVWERGAGRPAERFFIGLAIAEVAIPEEQAPVDVPELLERLRVAAPAPAWAARARLAAHGYHGPRRQNVATLENLDDALALLPAPSPLRLRLQLARVEVLSNLQRHGDALEEARAALRDARLSGALDLEGALLLREARLLYLLKAPAAPDLSVVVPRALRRLEESDNTSQLIDALHLAITMCHQFQAGALLPALSAAADDLRGEVPLRQRFTVRLLGLYGELDDYRANITALRPILAEVRRHGLLMQERFIRMQLSLAHLVLGELPEARDHHSQRVRLSEVMRISPQADAIFEIQLRVLEGDAYGALSYLESIGEVVSPYFQQRLRPWRALLCRLCERPSPPPAVPLRARPWTASCFACYVMTLDGDDAAAEAAHAAAVQQSLPCYRDQIDALLRATRAGDALAWGAAWRAAQAPREDGRVPLAEHDILARLPGLYPARFLPG